MKRAELNTRGASYTPTPAENRYGKANRVTPGAGTGAHARPQYVKQAPPASAPPPRNLERAPSGPSAPGNSPPVSGESRAHMLPSGPLNPGRLLPATGSQKAMPGRLSQKVKVNP